MNSLMDDSRPLRSETGFALIEVIVAAAVLAIVALAVLSGIDAASGASAREKARAVAASLAERDQERLRSMPYDQILRSGGVEQQPPIAVDGVTYTVESKAVLVTDDVGGTPECGNEGTQVAYVHITSKVTSNVVGRNIKPVEVDSLVPPTQKWAEGHGTLGIKVVDRSATQGVRNLAVSATSTAYTPPVGTTDADGCVVFTDVPVGTYTITLNSPGYIDRAGNSTSQTTANVVAKKVVFATMSYDVADSVVVEVKTHTPGKTWGDPTGRQAPSRAHKVSTLNGANVGLLRTVTPPQPTTPVTVDNLFPFAENSYAFFTGGCRYQSPDKVTSMSDASPLHPNYFSTTNGVNPDGAQLADPAVLNQTATVRQPPFAIRVASARSGAAFTDGAMEVWATLQKPSGHATDSCAEARFKLTTMLWDTERFGARTIGSGGDHWVSQTDGPFDPGMPFGTYTICLQTAGRRAYVHSATGPYGTYYANTSPDGRTAALEINGSRLTWNNGTCA